MYLDKFFISPGSSYRSILLREGLKRLVPANRFKRVALEPRFPATAQEPCVISDSKNSRKIVRPGNLHRNWISIHRPLNPNAKSIFPSPNTKLPRKLPLKNFLASIHRKNNIAHFELPRTFTFLLSRKLAALLHSCYQRKQTFKILSWPWLSRRPKSTFPCRGTSNPRASPHFQPHSPLSPSPEISFTFKI